MTKTSLYQRIHICTSGYCNNNCIFCCDRDPHIKVCRRHFALYRSPHLTLEGFRKESKRPKTIDSILFTGGEPTLNPDLLAFICDAKKRGYSKIALQTNARLLKYAAYARDIIEAGLNEINISIHGSEKKIHEAHTRTPGSFDDTCEGLSNVICLKEKHRFALTVNFTVTKLNIKNISDFLKMIDGFQRVDQIVLNMLMFTGNAKTFFPLLKISYRELATAISRLREPAKTVPFQVNTLPKCVLSDHDHRLLGIAESPLYIKANRAHILKRGALKTKGNACLKCIHYIQCDGIDAFYAKMMGWKEFSAKIL